MPSFEDVPDFQAGLHLERASAAGASIAAQGVAQVENSLQRKIAAGDDSGQVDVDCVSADDDGRHLRDGRVDHERDLDADGPQESHRRARRFLNRHRVSRGEDRGPYDAPHFGLVQLVVASQKRGDGLSVAEIDQKLGGGCFFGTEELTDVFNRALVGRRNGLVRQGRGGEAVRLSGFSDFCARSLVGLAAAAAVQRTLSSPVEQGTMNSCDESPPMGPLSASTIT